VPRTISFSFSDSAIPASAYPYELDPSLTFNVAASADDTYLLRTGTVYPPTGTIQKFDASTTVSMEKDKSGTQYQVRVGFMRWDTHMLQPSDVIASAKIRVRVTNSFLNNPPRVLNGEWYTAWPISTDPLQFDYTANIGTTASGAAGWAFPTAGVDADLPLTGFSNICQTGANPCYTGVRVGVSGTTAPTSSNGVQAASYDHTSLTEPRLIVVINDAPPTQPSSLSPADAANVPLVTPVLSGTSTDPNGDPINYRFEVDDDSNFQIPLIASSGWMPTTNTWTVPAGMLQEQKTYYWHVQAEDPDELTSPWSATQSFAVRVAKLGSRDYWPMWSRGPVSVNQASGNLVLSAPGPFFHSVL